MNWRARRRTDANAEGALCGAVWQQIQRVIAHIRECERRMIMAQLYKMTLYVCDLEDSLSLDEIKTLIEQDALNGISVNCVCLFLLPRLFAEVQYFSDQKKDHKQQGAHQML